MGKVKWVVCWVVTCEEKEKKKIGHHARPQAGIGHSAPAHMHRTGLLVLQSGPS